MIQDSADIDPVDLKLLSALQDNGALTNQELADAVRLSPSQCSRRRQRLEQSGVIRRYRADLDPAKLGFGITVFIFVTLATHSRNNARRFRDLVATLAMVQETHALTGDSDYLLKVIVTDLRALSALVNDVLLPHETVERVKSSIVLETLKDDARLPLG
ncbi:Lrp/AsnC family transcriptional regulator [Pseudorhodoplanes sp.]|jgi:DNA-binding Lrp family transcriptional regulator|uniref:Lrp/AsnC family transcriptional regulator n=1 Tax=Pseudorhodoplanes sp. TaxID=1934341 RepID=UPI002B568F26|nr:Lrp/AsnC family transcriptional regulator [Pseudorhodoplanes sp.]HWV44345.1 Lrp/AsnC family transcriptional regulator [Pseudorhodoplanes sp.]